MKETFEPIGGATESPEIQKFISDSIGMEKKSLEIFPESKVSKAFEAISKLTAKLSLKA